MKSYKVKVIVLFVLSMSVLSCSQDETTTSGQENFKKENLIVKKMKNPLLGNFFMNSYSLFKRIKAAGKLDKLRAYNRNGIDRTDVSDVLAVLGFSSLDEFMTLSKKQVILANKIEDKYKFSNLPKKERAHLVKKAVMQDGLYNKIAPTCDYDNCALGATAIFALETAGCASLDVTVIAGVICHEAAAVHYGSMLNDCEADCKQLNARHNFKFI